MNAGRTKILYVITAAALSLGIMDAQPRSAGISYSFGGFALVYEHALDNEEFIEIAAEAVTTEMFMGRSSLPGASLSFTWNIIFSSVTSRNGNTVNLFAASGAIAGISRDFKTSSGIFYGLKCRVGAECIFSRHVSISACLAPVIGSHIVLHRDSVSMKYYMNGFLEGIMPEVGIKYWF